MNENKVTKDQSISAHNSDLKNNEGNQVEEAASHELNHCRECWDAGRMRCVCSQDIPDPLSSCFVVTYSNDQMKVK